MAFGTELPDDIVADVLRRLPPRSLAVSRCVCRAWRDLVDSRRLLRADLLPRSVGGIFMNYTLLYVPEFLARPTTGPSISGDFEFSPELSTLTDHCNGLVLCTENSDDHDYVANPATRQWARLPLPPETDSEMWKKGFCRIKCLVYDPSVSPHYDVLFLIHTLDKKDQHKSGQMMTQSERPPVSLDPLLVYVYSSKTNRWEERWFAPEGRMVETTLAIDDGTRLNKVYCRGALYLLSKNGFVLRISISNAKCTLIPSPTNVEFSNYGCFSLGSSENRVYCAFKYDWHRFRFFLLDESCGQMVWELRHSIDLRTFARKVHHAREDYSGQPNGPWILQDINYYNYPYDNGLHREGVEDNFEWNSDDDNVLFTENMVEGRYEGYTELLGFHPYKQIVFLNAALSRALAYHWKTSKFQDLGNIFPTDYHNLAGHVAGIESSFIYTPCWMEDLPNNSLEVPIED